MYNSPTKWVQSRLTDTEFDSIQDICTIRLSRGLRQQVRRVVIAHVLNRRVRRQRSISLEDLCLLPNKIVEAVGLIRVKDKRRYRNLVTHSKRPKPNEIVKFIARLIEAYERVYEAHENPRRRKPDYELLGVLQELELIFKKAGGGASGVSKNDDAKRESRFVDFAIRILNCLAGSLRPRSFDALAARWERHYAGRKKTSRLPSEIEWTKDPDFVSMIVALENIQTRKKKH
jgi:hypothetical protein